MVLTATAGSWHVTLVHEARLVSLPREQHCIYVLGVVYQRQDGAFLRGIGELLRCHTVSTFHFLLSRIKSHSINVFMYFIVFKVNGTVACRCCFFFNYI